MHPRTRELLDNLAVHRAALKKTVDEIPRDLHAVRPRQDRWSIVDVLNHLAIMERRLSGVFEQQIAGARQAGLREETDTSSALGTLPLARLLDRSRKLTAPEIVQPPPSTDTDAALAALDASRARLHSVIESGDGLALGELKFPHPVLGELTMYGWYEFIAGHEARHTAQIAEIAAELEGRPPAAS